MVKLSKDIRLVNAELGQEEAEEGPEGVVDTWDDLGTEGLQAAAEAV